MRINKYLARAKGLSRRQSDELIASGRVRIGRKTAKLGQSVEPSDKVYLDDALLITPELTYIAFHKPRGYVCSRRKQGENDTIYAILPEFFKHLKPVGRLDKDSSGIILLSDDGDFSFAMTHPSFQKVKIYEVHLDKPLTKTDREQIIKGVALEDGTSAFDVDREGQSVTVTMQEGRNRQIRRTFGVLGYEVVGLHRIQFGPYKLGNIPEGKYERISPNEQ